MGFQATQRGSYIPVDEKDPMLISSMTLKQIRRKLVMLGTG